MGFKPTVSPWDTGLVVLLWLFPSEEAKLEDRIEIAAIAPNFPHQFSSPPKAVMFKQIATLIWHSKPRWLYGCLSLLTILTIWFSSGQVARAGLLDALFRGIQILQLDNMSSKQEMRLGGQIDQQIKRQLYSNRTPVLSQKHDVSKYVDGIGQDLVQQLTGEERRKLNYTFQVVVDPNVNAFATMGGFVYVNTGLMELADNEAELASVIGHEIGHIVEEHAIDRMKDRAIQEGILSAADLSNENAIRIGAELALNLPNSRKDELQADAHGLSNLRRADYDPKAMVSFMSKLAQGNRSTIQILNTHPNPGKRVAELEEDLEENPPTADEIRGVDGQSYCTNLSRLSNQQLACK